MLFSADVDSYFQDGLRSLEHISAYIQTLSATLHKIRQKQEEERKKLVDVKNLLRASSVFDKEVSIFFFFYRVLPSFTEFNPVGPTFMASFLLHLPI